MSAYFTKLDGTMLASEKSIAVTRLSASIIKLSGNKSDWQNTIGSRARSWTRAVRLVNSRNYIRFVRLLVGDVD